jgi:hypothetical protein
MDEPSQDVARSNAPSKVCVRTAGVDGAYFDAHQRRPALLAHGRSHVQPVLCRTGEVDLKRRESRDLNRVRYCDDIISCKRRAKYTELDRAGFVKPTDI